MLQQQKTCLENSGSEYHIPVMLLECLDGLNIRPDGVYVDVTYGAGGHSKAILEKLSSDGRLFVFDTDPDAKQNILDDPRLVFFNDRFSTLQENLRLHRVFKVDGILADLGVSSHQLDTAERGFSTRFDADLDLRMSTNTVLTAKMIINYYSFDELRAIFKKYGELKNDRAIAQSIVKNREIQPINTTFELKQTIQHLAIRGQENRFFAMVFQALRIEVNGELNELRELMSQGISILNEGGRLVVMSYHSLEDRIVKNYMRSGNEDNIVEKDFFGNKKVPIKQIHSKPITASDEELERNPRSRSAKLRIAERIEN